MTEVSRMEELRALSLALKKSAEVPPPAVVARQPPPPVSSLPELRIALGPLDQTALWTEYRNKNQHRHALYFHRMTEVKKLLTKWKLLDLRESTAHFFSSFDSLHFPIVAPSRPYAELTLARLRISRTMLELILSAIERAYSAIRELLSQRFFMAFSMLCMAMLSRFHSELVAVDELLSLLTERLAAFLAFAAPSAPSLALSTLLTELGSLASNEPPHRSPTRALLPTTGGIKHSTPSRAVATAVLDLGEPLKRTLFAISEVKRPVDTTSSPVPESAAKKMKSPQPASPTIAVTPTVKAAKPSSKITSQISTPSFVKSVQTTPTGSFWTPSPSTGTPQSASSSPSLFAVSPVAPRSPALPKIAAAGKPKMPPAKTSAGASSKKVDDLMVVLSGRGALN